jgi:hypothetical protein
MATLIKNERSSKKTESKMSEAQKKSQNQKNHIKS